MVSIIMPAYNAGSYISESIDSVLAQSFTQWELVISDDGSTDNTLAIVQVYSLRDHRVRLVQTQKNQGAAAARNLAISASIGRFIAFLDSDDLWMPKKLEIQIDRMLKEKAVLSYTAYRKITEQGVQGTHVIEVPATTNYDTLLQSNTIACLTAVYDSQAIGKMYFPEIKQRQDHLLWLKILKRIGHEDYSFWLKILKFIDKSDNRFDVTSSPEPTYVLGINEPLAWYRVRKNSLSGNKFKAAAFQWVAYRHHEKLSLFRSLGLMVVYGYRGFKKHLTF